MWEKEDYLNAIVCFCPNCGRLGEHKRLNEDLLDCCHCNMKGNIPADAREEFDVAEQEIFVDS